MPMTAILKKNPEIVELYWGADHSFSWDQKKFLIGKTG